MATGRPTNLRVILPREPPPPSIPMSAPLRDYLTSAITKFDASLIRSLQENLFQYVQQVIAAVTFMQTTLVGTKDGANTVFSIPYTIGYDAMQVPLALLMQRNLMVPYTETIPPPSGRWAYDPLPLDGYPNGRVYVGDAPLNGDKLEFAWLISAVR